MSREKGDWRRGWLEITLCKIPAVDADDDGTSPAAWDCPAAPACAFCWTVAPLSTSSNPPAPFSLLRSRCSRSRRVWGTAGWAEAEGHPAGSARDCGTVGCTGGGSGAAPPHRRLRRLPSDSPNRNRSQAPPAPAASGPSHPFNSPWRIDLLTRHLFCHIRFTKPIEKPYMYKYISARVESARDTFPFALSFWEIARRESYCGIVGWLDDVYREIHRYKNSFSSFLYLFQRDENLNLTRNNFFNHNIKYIYLSIRGNCENFCQGLR